jgi:hypothetical protein
MSETKELTTIDETKLNEALPNLDGFGDTDDLQAFRDEVVQVIEALQAMSSIADAMQQARYYRKIGNIRQAKIMEGIADSIYSNLPNFARW